MTGLGTTIGSLLAAGVVAAGSLLGSGSGAHPARTALVIDASLARDGRELVAPRLRALDAELRLPRTAAEAATDLRYLAARGYRLEVAGPDSRAAAKATGVHVAALRR
jgi:hypothetical protein